MTEQTMITGIIQEEWRSISEYMNYQVSNLGRIRNIRAGKNLKLRTAPSGYLTISLYAESNLKTHHVHRLVATEFIDNPDNKTEVDHIDHNRTNNCINNLRWALRSENHMNRNKQQKPCSSCFKGVRFHTHSQKWRAEIKIDGRKIYIGCFANEIDAARAYNDKAQQLFGDFANLNDIS